MKKCEKCNLITAYFFGNICPYCKLKFGISIFSLFKI